MCQKRSKNQFRRERQKLRKVAAINSAIHTSDNEKTVESVNQTTPSNHTSTTSIPSSETSPTVTDLKTDVKSHESDSHSKKDKLPSDVISQTVNTETSVVIATESQREDENASLSLEKQSKISGRAVEKSSILGEGKDIPKIGVEESEEANGKSATAKALNGHVPGGIASGDKDSSENALESNDSSKSSPKVSVKPATGLFDTAPVNDRNPEVPDANEKASDSEDEDTADNDKAQLLGIFSQLKEQPSSQVDTTESSDPLFSQYASIFHKFEPEPEAKPQRQVIPYTEQDDVSSELSSTDESDNEDDQGKSLSKRQKRLKEKIPISVLKSSAAKPQAVEWYDADAPDPYMAVYMKTAINHVAVPSHWQQKKEYLSSKRGVERPPFVLPKFIENTGIADMRNHDPESLKKSQRDRVQPKMGRLDIDYQKLHDAFFKHQTKPRMLAFGEVYSEGREKADQHNHDIGRMRPGKISMSLRSAVGMPEKESAVPPWIAVMKDLGKPPSYQNLLIPGLDVEYTNSGYRVQYGEKGQAQGLSLETWGNLEDGEESEAESEESESEEEVPDDDNDVDDDVEVGTLETKEGTLSINASDDEQPERVAISEYSKIKSSGSSHANQNSSGALYKVLKERPADSTSGDGKQKYDLEQNHQENPKKEKISSRRRSDHAEDFRF